MNRPRGGPSWTGLWLFMWCSSQYGSGEESHIFRPKLSGHASRLPQLHTLTFLSESDVINTEDLLIIRSAWPRGKILLSLVESRKGLWEKELWWLRLSLENVHLCGERADQWKLWNKCEENNWFLNVRIYDGLFSKYLNALKIEIHYIKFLSSLILFSCKGKKYLTNRNGKQTS